MRLQVWSLALLSGLTTWGCRELWCRSKTRLRYGVAVALVKASGCSFHLTPILGSFICCKCSSKGKKKKVTSKYRHPLFYCALQILYFLQTEGLWQPCHKWANLLTPFSSRSIDFVFLCPILEILIILFVMVMCDQWLRQKDYDSLKAQMIAGIFFSNIVPFN